MVGLKFTASEKSFFQQALQRTAFHADWRAKCGEAAWNVLEEYVAALS